MQQSCACGGRQTTGVPAATADSGRSGYLGRDDSGIFHFSDYGVTQMGVDDLSANDSEEFACLLGAQHRHHIQLCKPPCPHPNTHRSNSHKNKNQNGRRCQIHKTRPVYQLLQEPSRKLGRYDP
jgi:hypothetical protein